MLTGFPSLVPFKEKKLTVPIKPTPFPEGRVARVSVNSFGIGGSNAHVSDIPSNSKPTCLVPNVSPMACADLMITRSS